ncbi:slr1659 superfamily regulator [Coleofasciculus sp. G1-WW12-02]|uniref:slr1659 superfamily regulator n=1 Tax=unclassified Coleofasciculus TaxID=2692782 RepID=UPI0032FBFB58
MSIQTEDYTVWYEPTTATVNFKGLLRESLISDYKPIEELLDQVMVQELPLITMNLQQLEFLNSSGMSVLSRFVIRVRKQKITQLMVKGSTQMPWQNKLLSNWQRLVPTLKMEWD